MNECISHGSLKRAKVKTLTDMPKTGVRFGNAATIKNKIIAGLVPKVIPSSLH
jgi:hypothetical protein